MKRKTWIISGILLLSVFIALPSCKNTENSPKHYEKMEKKMMKQEQKGYEAAKKEHLKIQSKNTRKMMRDSKKRAKGLNKPKKR